MKHIVFSKPCRRSLSLQYVDTVTCSQQNFSLTSTPGSARVSQNGYHLIKYIFLEGNCENRTLVKKDTKVKGSSVRERLVPVIRTHSHPQAKHNTTARCHQHHCYRRPPAKRSRFQQGLSQKFSSRMNVRFCPG